MEHHPSFIGSRTAFWKSASKLASRLCSGVAQTDSEVMMHNRNKTVHFGTSSTGKVVALSLCHILTFGLWRDALNTFEGVFEHHLTGTIRLK